MRSIYEAVPGHVLVGADASQIELRLYVLFSGDKLLWPMFLDAREDPHSFNFASMAVGHNGEAAIRVFYEDMKAKRLAAKKAGGKDKVIELLRTIAKRFCVAEGEPVLVRRAQETLEVPIQDVASSDEVWDGIEWVRHDGVICNGVREVIEHDGLWLTDDHEVWLATGEKVAFGEAARRGAALARTGEGRNPIRFVADVDGGVAGRSTPEGGGPLHLRQDGSGLLGQPEVEEVGELHVLRPTAGASQALDARRRDDRSTGLAARSDEHGASTLLEFKPSLLGSVRRSGDQVQLSVDCGGSIVDCGESRTASGAGDRPDRHERALRTGQPAVGDESTAGNEPTEYAVSRIVDLPTGRMATDAEGRREEAACGNDAGADSRRGQDARAAAQSRSTPPRRRMVRVYDILNAGPRRRFTAGGKLLHNCYLLLYGGEREKLFSVMSCERNIDGSLTFPGLREGDVKKWYDNFNKAHPEMRAWQQAVIRGFHSNGCVRSIIDFRGRFFKGGFDRNAVINFAIQPSAASLINKSMIEVASQIPYGGLSPYTGPVLQVHDYIGVQVPETHGEWGKKIVEHAMNVEYGGMPFPSESKPIATNWSQH
jgi:hypothetical protein